MAKKVSDPEPEVEAPIAPAAPFTPPPDSREIVIFPDVHQWVPNRDFAGIYVTVGGKLYAHVDEFDGLWRYRPA